MLLPAMDDEQLIRAIATFIVVGLLVPATLWYLGLRFGKPEYQGLGLIVAAIYIAVTGYNVTHDWLDWFPVTYRADVSGPDERTRGETVVGDTQYRVNVEGARHQMVLTPVAKYDDRPTAAVSVSYEVQSPSGRVVAKGRETLLPKPYSWTFLRTSKAATWMPLKAEFISPEEGEHRVILEIPKPVRKVRVEIAERKK
jgi:hypothetical protein